jgi:hypothetical protein
MTIDEPRHESDCDDDRTPKDDGKMPKDECGDCDPQRIDDLKCEAAGVAAQAAYNAVYQAAIADAQAKYNDTRNSYRSTRSDVALDVQDMRHQVKRVIDRIKCLIQRERIIDCLDDAWCDVRHDLKECWKGGCCVSDEDCVFDTCDESLDEKALNALIAKYTEHADRAHQCFDALTGEPAALAQRVRDRKADLDALLATLAANDASTDLKLVYATALVLQYNLSIVWNGFKETKHFVECLCRSLQCWTEASAAIAVLKGRLAVLECKAQAAADHCTYLQTHTVEEILAVYDKKCCTDPCDEQSTGDEHDDDENGDRDHDDRDHDDRDHDDRDHGDRDHDDGDERTAAH